MINEKYETERTRATRRYNNFRKAISRRNKTRIGKVNSKPVISTEDLGRFIKNKIEFTTDNNRYFNIKEKIEKHRIKEELEAL